MEKRAPSGAIPKFKGEILLCEDNEINQHFIKSQLNRVGFDVVVAGNGCEGVDIIKGRIKKGERPFDLIFMDIQMPVMDGLEAGGIILGLGTDAPIVALTANVTENDREIYAAHGMRGSLCKPFTPDELWACLNEYFKPVSHEMSDEKERLEQEEKQRKKLLSSFVRRNQNTYNEICSALEAGDVKKAHRIAHTIRGLAGLMGKKELQEASRVVESALAGGEAAALGQRELEAMGRELADVLAELAPFMEELNQESEAGLDKNMLREIFDKLEPLLRGDSAQSQKFADALRPVPGMKELIILLEDYEFEAAISVLAELRKTLDL